MLQADWDPRTAGDSYRFLVLRPQRRPMACRTWRAVRERRWAGLRPRVGPAPPPPWVMPMHGAGQFCGGGGSAGELRVFGRGGRSPRRRRCRLGPADGSPGLRVDRRGSGSRSRLGDVLRGRCGPAAAWSVQAGAGRLGRARPGRSVSAGGGTRLAVGDAGLVGRLRDAGRCARSRQARGGPAAHGDDHRVGAATGVLVDEPACRATAGAGRRSRRRRAGDVRAGRRPGHGRRRRIDAGPGDLERGDRCAGRVAHAVAADRGRSVGASGRARSVRGPPLRAVCRVRQTGDPRSASRHRRGGRRLADLDPARTRVHRLPHPAAVAVDGSACAGDGGGVRRESRRQCDPRDSPVRGAAHPPRMARRGRRRSAAGRAGRCRAHHPDQPRHSGAGPAAGQDDALTGETLS